MARTLTEWLQWQETLHPLSIDLGLERVRHVASQLELLAPSFPLISVAGTNGKGSSVAMLQSIYQHAGYTTGVYTSPHLLRYNERIVIDGEEVSDDALCDAFEKINLARGAISLSYFEFATLAAMVLFFETSVDIALLEVGLGGRLDAVNLWDADIALITTIAIDHESWLGNNRNDIAVEKAGIMRANHPVVCGDKQPPSTIASEAKRKGAILFQRGKAFSLSRKSIEKEHWQWFDLKHQTVLTLNNPALRGDFQFDNAANIIMVVQQLQPRLFVSTASINTALQAIPLLGRLQRVAQCPEILVDVAHNPHAAEQLASYLKTHPSSAKTVALFSLLEDKDLVGIISPFEILIDEWHIIPMDSKRAQCVDVIKLSLKQQQIKAPIQVHIDFKSALQALKNTLKCEDRVVAFGSFLVVSSILESL